jgi:hypothetical protein
MQTPTVVRVRPPPESLAAAASARRDFRAQLAVELLLLIPAVVAFGVAPGPTENHHGLPPEA